MTNPLSRRALLAAATALPIIGLAGCATGGLRNMFDPVDAIRRLLTISAQRAFARMLEPDGFLQDALLRLRVPEELGGARTPAVISAILSTPAIQRRLEDELNRAAYQVADDAAPAVYELVRSFTIGDAARIIRAGRSPAATEALRAAAGRTILDVVLPGVGAALRADTAGAIDRVLRAAGSNFSYARLADDVARQTNDAIFRAIAREEEAIRADPSSSRDRVIEAVFGAARLAG